MRLISADARLVIIGDPGPIEILAERLGDRHRSLIEIRAAQDFLVPFGLSTLEGEARQRAMEGLYASLRGKIIVRLLTANLNPEAIRLAGEAPLKRLRRDWETIRGNMRRLLKESTDHGVLYVTVIVTEEGDWRPEFRDDLSALVGLGRECEGEHSSPSRAPLPDHRCYLLTRILELGQSSVVFAKDVWPDLVAGLIDYLRLVDTTDARREALRSDGLFAWRTVRFVAGIDESLLEAGIARAIKVANEALLQSSPEVLFEPKTVSTGDDVSAQIVCAPPDWGQADQAEAGKPWTINSEWIPRYGGPNIWKDRIAQYADSVRNAIWVRANSEYKMSEVGTVEVVQSVRIRVQQAKHSGTPGALFPGPLGEVSAKTNREGPALHSVRHARTAAFDLGSRLAGFLSAHESASRAFVPSGERAMIGVAIGMALCFSVLMVSALASGWAGSGIQGWLLGAWLTVWALVGVGTSLLIGFLLQRKRLRDASEVVQQTRDAWIQSLAKIPERTADALDRGARIAQIRGLRAGRKIFHHRLMRIQATLQNEMQPVAAFQQGSSAETASPWMRFKYSDGIIDFPVLAKSVGDTTTEDLSAFVSEELVSKFKSDWQELIKIDEREIGFLPVSDLLGLAADHADRLVRGVRTWLRERRVQEMHTSDRYDESLVAWEDAIRTAQVAETDSPTRFFSVDLPSGAQSAARLFVLDDFSANSFDGVRTTSPKRLDVNAADLGSGVLGFWYGDVKLDFSRSNSDGSICFVAEGRSPANSELGGV